MSLGHYRFHFPTSPSSPLFSSFPEAARSTHSLPSRSLPRLAAKYNYGCPSQEKLFSTFLNSCLDASVKSPQKLTNINAISVIFNLFSLSDANHFCYEFGVGISRSPVISSSISFTVSAQHRREIWQRLIWLRMGGA